MSEVSEKLKEICCRIEERYEIKFVEIGMEEDHVHFLVQSVPTIPVSRIVMTIKNITEKQIFYVTISFFAVYASY